MGHAASIHNKRNSVVSKSYGNVCDGIEKKNPNIFKNAIKNAPDEVILKLMNDLEELKSKAEKNLRHLASIPTDKLDLPLILQRFSPLCDDERIEDSVWIADRAVSLLLKEGKSDIELEEKLRDLLETTKNVIGERLREKNMYQHCKDVVNEGNADFVNVYEAVWNTIENKEIEQIEKFKITNQKIKVFHEEHYQQANEIVDLFKHAANAKPLYDRTVKKILDNLNFTPWNVSLPEKLKSAGRVAEKAALRTDKPGCTNKIFDVVRGMIVLVHMDHIAQILQRFHDSPETVLTRVKERFYSEPSPGMFIITFRFLLYPLNSLFLSLSLSHTHTHRWMAGHDGEFLHHKRWKSPYL